MEASELALRIVVVMLGLLTGVATGLALNNRRELKMHRHGLSKLIDMVTKLEIEMTAKKITDQIADLVMGKDSPEDLEKAIREVAEKEGFDATVIKAKKTAKKSTKKSTKKEK